MLRRLALNVCLRGGAFGTSGLSLVHWLGNNFNRVRKDSELGKLIVVGIPHKNSQAEVVVLVMTAQNFDLYIETYFVTNVIDSRL